MAVIVVSTSQNAFIEAKQILNVILIANEAIDPWLKSSFNGNST